MTSYTTPGHATLSVMAISFKLLAAVAAEASTSRLSMLASFSLRETSRCCHCLRLRVGTTESTSAGHVHNYTYTLDSGIHKRNTSTRAADPGTLRRQQGSNNVESGLNGKEPGLEKETKGVVTKMRLEPSPEELKNAEPWMVEELKAYYFGRKRLAEMMGQDPETFTDQDVQEALRYLLPTRLTAKDARPFLKHPFEVFPKRKEAVFDASSRPLEPAFYTGSPAYHNLIYKIYQQSKLLEEAWPDVGGDKKEDERAGEEEDVPEESSRDQSVPMYWMKKSTLADMLAEEISDKQYDDIIARLSKLAENPLSEKIKDFLDQYRRSMFVYRSHANIPKLDEEGKVKAIGKRKTSTAEVTAVKGSGEVNINGRQFIDYFPRLEDRQQVLYPLVVTDQLGLYDIRVKVKGGGITGQAGAIRLGLSKALLAFPGDHGDVLEKAGLLVRDPRAVERKKPGQKKARKKFTWVKR